MTAKSRVIKGMAVNPAIVQRKWLNLPREVCSVSQPETEMSVRMFDRKAEVSSGRSSRKQDEQAPKQACSGPLMVKAQTVPARGFNGKGK